LAYVIVVEDSSDEDDTEDFINVLYEEWEDTAKYVQCMRNHQRLLNKYDGRTLIDEIQEGRKVVKEKRVVIGVIWIEDEPGYDAPQYVLKTDMLDRAQRSEETVENYLISVETLKTMVFSLEDEIACAKMMKNSTVEENDENDKENCVPGWARSNNYKKTRKAIEGRKKK